jgi:hypothetical protein
MLSAQLRLWQLTTATYQVPYFYNPTECKEYCAITFAEGKVELCPLICLRVSWNYTHLTDNTYHPTNVFIISLNSLATVGKSPLWCICISRQTEKQGNAKEYCGIVTKRAGKQRNLCWMWVGGKMTECWIGAESHWHDLGGRPCRSSGSFHTPVRQGGTGCSKARRNVAGCCPSHPSTKRLRWSKSMYTQLFSGTLVNCFRRCSLDSVFMTLKTLLKFL